ncbi:putative N-acetyltransferase HLS1-like [Dichanthelium oligosanthes]|uniref:Putative N-acetyltransferase HLS1-like n=1 Tax=Dichanthelium oligosanthes TaxID=888268 RepID=A0A1E5VMA7_9POAL|nr:putative N-acetyltransferase HLS1-like [Dichanthelium oligosanthes]
MGVVDEAEPMKKTMIRVREFDVAGDLRAVEELERLCQVGLSGDQGSDPAADHDGGAEEKKRSGKKKQKKKSGMSLYVEQIGDPFARVRHAPDHVMLVAVYGEEEEVVGVIKACTRMVSRGKKKHSFSSSKQQFVKVACLLGLRVSPSHRRLGIATELVRRAESWCAARGAAYATMATTESNAASLALFAGRFAYAPFRRPVFLGHPVHRHRARVPRAHRVLRLPPPLAAAAYAALLPPSAAEFLPADLPALLNHKLTLGTYLAIERGGPEDPARPPSFAVLSVWDATRSLRLRVGGAPTLLRASLAAARALDRHAPWLQVPSVPDIFRPFGTYLLYGLRMSGPEGPALLRSLCRHAHNVARKNPACAVLAADLGPEDPAAAVVPHWPKFSCDEDVWCIKKLGATADGNAAGDDTEDDWTTSPPPGVLFVDPREF